MHLSRTYGIVLMGLTLGLSLACGRATGIPGKSASDNPSQTVPFDHEPHPQENLPSVPPRSGVVLPGGTPLAVSLVKPLSSASSHPGDTFEGTLDEPIMVENQTVVSRGADVRGRVLAARAAGRGRGGYLRVALVSLAIDGKPVTVETSSLFVKAGGSRNNSAEATFQTTKAGEVEFGLPRRLTFRLARAVDLPK